MVWVNLKACSRSNILHLEKGEHNVGGDKSFWFGNHSRITHSSKKQSLLNDVISRAKEMENRLPVTSIYSRFRISDTHDILPMRVYFNPETGDFEPPQQSAWATNDWHKGRIYTDQKKVAYVEKIKKWVAAFVPKVEAGLKSKLVSARTVVK
jgi:hypothetical protein